MAWEPANPIQAECPEESRRKIGTGMRPKSKHEEKDENKSKDKD
jgi:hypothetical protein